VLGGSGQVAWAPWDGADPRALSADALLSLELHAYEAGGPRAAAVNAGSLVPWLQPAAGLEAANAAAVEVRCKHDLHRLMDALIGDRPGPGWGFRLKTLLRAGDGTPGNPQFFTLRNTWVGAGRIRQNELAGAAKDKLTYARFVLYDGQETVVQDALSGSRSSIRGDSVPMTLAVHWLVDLRGACIGTALRKPTLINWFALRPQHRAWLDCGLGIYDEAGSIGAAPRVACGELKDLPAGERGYSLEARIDQSAGTAVRQVVFPAGDGVLPLRIAWAVKGKEATADVSYFEGRIATAHLVYPKSVRLTGRLQTGSGLVCEEEVLELEELELAADDPVFDLATPVDGKGGFLRK
jgi:hypothetical protein